MNAQTTNTSQIPHVKVDGFTLVELIVVVTILAILATIGFVSYSSYLTGVRDTNRLAQLVSIHDGLELYRTKKDLPLPDDHIDVKANGVLISYQGFAGQNTLETIDFTKGGKDPKDNQYFSYYLTQDRKYFQLLTLLEEEENLQAHEHTVLNGILTQEGNRVHAADYRDRVPAVHGKKLGILTDSANTPIQEVGSVVTTGELNLTSANIEYIGHITDRETYTGSTILSVNPKASCKRIKQIKGGSTDGVYKINPEGNNPFDVYCDMTTDGGGWTMGIRLNTTDAHTRRYDDVFWGTSGNIGDLLDENDYNSEYIDINNFSEVLLDFKYGKSKRIASAYSNTKNILSLRDNYTLPLQNTNESWINTFNLNSTSKDFFGDILSFNIPGDGGDGFRIWYNKAAKTTCNQGGGIGTKGDAYSWWAEATFTSESTPCQENIYKLYLGTNFGGAHAVITNPAYEVELSPREIYDTNLIRILVR